MEGRAQQGSVLRPRSSSCLLPITGNTAGSCVPPLLFKLQAGSGEWQVRPEAEVRPDVISGFILSTSPWNRLHATGLQHRGEKEAWTESAEVSLKGRT